MEARGGFLGQVYSTEFDEKYLVEDGGSLGWFGWLVGYSVHSRQEGIQGLSEMEGTTN